jgi:limonene-1,2-epoxide hydrolase
MTPLETVNAFIQAIENRNVDAAIALVSDNCEYDNVPMGKVFGPEAISSMLKPMIEGCSEVAWPVHREAATENIVFNERTDKFHMPFGWLEMPVTGVWEVVDGKITLWRDYFDLQTYMKQLPTTKYPRDSGVVLVGIANQNDTRTTMTSGFRRGNWPG